ncbi:hypothetical protein [Thalassospira sp.]|uniref:hypothetical protein n=1 Tax=Thalassospira sp. TaxID=1912094 RepID=UPI001B25F635|nr:hypothetical protein [Thalassospira sp.]MBO6808455.1 hypothetical protein [Thalassospira sp.]MBO6839847.1 hypothetical protein [Thalassospira sp.]
MKRLDRFEMRVSSEFMAIIDEWRRTQPDIPSRAEALRRLAFSGFMVPSDTALKLIEHAVAHPTEEIASVVADIKNRAAQLSDLQEVAIVGDTPAEQLAKILLQKTD